VISIKKCNEILNKKGNRYSEQEVKSIRDYLTQMAEIICELKMKKE
jgi:hypothetical protein|tara:strand:+ start:838 stop:975 length:138 start_codon:yes stop_codon:yes gene_type:complete